MAQTPSEAPPPAPVAHAQTTPSSAPVHTHAHPPARMFGDTVTAHHVTKVSCYNQILSLEHFLLETSLPARQIIA